MTDNAADWLKSQGFVAEVMVIPQDHAGALAAGDLDNKAIRSLFSKAAMRGHTPWTFEGAVIHDGVLVMYISLRTEHP